jgi:hypothetical protein
MRLAYLSQPAGLISQFSQLIDSSKLLRTDEELKFRPWSEALGVRDIIRNVLGQNIQLSEVQELKR